MPHSIKRVASNRRSGKDRRKVYSLDYFANGGIERRYNIKDRRTIVEDMKRFDIDDIPSAL